ncbi:MAG: sugar kinase [Streptococcus sp.]|nr:sugar kinase [Streptococcus sp.]
MAKILTIGESLVRFSTDKKRRLQESDQLDVAIGGAEYNVAWNLGNLGNNVSFASVLPSNSFSKRVVTNLKSVSVDVRNVIFEKEGRIGIYFLELGDGLRTSQVTYDRKYSSFSSILDFPWELNVLFKDITHLHLSGITLALSEFWQTNGYILVKEAKKRGIYISFDMNFRATMWSIETAKSVYQSVLPFVDFLSASYLDAVTFLDISLADEVDKIEYIKAIGNKYSNLSYIYGTERTILTPNHYELRGFLYDNTIKEVFLSKSYDIQSVIDRVGAGDSYASGILDGLIKNNDNQIVVDFATAASVLKHSILGDVNHFEYDEIMKFSQNHTSIVR